MKEMLELFNDWIKYNDIDEEPRIELYPEGSGYIINSWDNVIFSFSTLIELEDKLSERPDNDAIQHNIQDNIDRGTYFGD
jgi:hypothetical protein